MKPASKLVLFVLLLCVVAQPALAETQSIEEYGITYTVSTFDGDFPAEVSGALQALGLAQGEPLRIPTLDGAHLMLVTCYPFYYSGHAPQKYVVLASKA